MVKFSFSQWVSAIIAAIMVILYFAVADPVIGIAFLFILVVSLTTLMVGTPVFELRPHVYGRQGFPIRTSLRELACKERTRLLIEKDGDCMLGMISQTLASQYTDS